MNTMKKKWSLLSVLCLLLSVLLVVSSCTVVDPNELGTNEKESTGAPNTEAPTQDNGSNDDTPPADSNKVAFSITLKDAENYGWANVRVQICEKGESGKCSTPANTDENGNAVITIDKTMLDLNNSAIKIVKADGYVTTTAAIDIIPGETSKTIKLAEYVVKADNFGSAVKGVEATVSLEGTAVAKGTTDESGTVKFLLITDDDYVLTVTSPTGATLIDSTETSWTFGENFIITLEYIVVNLVDKTVTVLDANAQPVVGATVILVSPSEEKDAQGNYIAAYTGTTDAAGKVTFTGLNGVSRYFVVVNNVAIMGTDGELAWLDMGMTELTVTYSTEPVGNVKYTVKVGYTDAEFNYIVLEGAYVVIVYVYNDDLEIVEVQRFTTVNGVVEFELPAGEYYVKIDEASVPDGYKSTSATGFFSNVAELVLEAKPAGTPGDSAQNPIQWVTTDNVTWAPIETTQTLTGLMQGQSVWYQLSLSAGMQMTVETTTMGAIVAIDYNGRTLYAENGTLTFTFDEVSPRQQQAIFRVYLEGRISPADVKLTVKPAGSTGGDSGNTNPDNLTGSGTEDAPYILTANGTYTAVVTVSDFWANAVYYKITVTQDGSLLISGIGNNHSISMMCPDKGIYSDMTSPESGINQIIQSVKAGEVWVIVVTTANWEADQVSFTVNCSNQPVPDTKYTVKVGYYDADYNFVLLEGAYTIILYTFNEEYEEVEVQRFTTVNGVIEFERPDGTYFVMIDEASVPDGYAASGSAYFTTTAFLVKVANVELEKLPDGNPGESAEYPIQWETTDPMTWAPIETTQTLTGMMPNEPVWYQLSMSVGMELVVETTTMGAVIVVEYNGRTLTAEFGSPLTLAFEEVSPRQQPALFCVYLGGRISPADAKLTVREVSSNGNTNPDNLEGAGNDANPFILTQGGTYTAVVTKNNFFMNPAIYEITILANGTLTVSGLGNNHWIRMECIAKSLSTDSTNPDENVSSISQAVNVGEVWRIIVGTWDEEAGEVGFTVTLS